jgi:hypothetical protein
MRSHVALTWMFVLAIWIGGCAMAPPKSALQLSADTLERRHLQTRRFDGISEEAILNASAGVLQDLGFSLDESETELGVIVASKNRTAIAPAQVVTSILLKLFLDIEKDVDDRQYIRVALVSRPVDELKNDSFRVRVTFQRVVWQTSGEVSTTEAIDDPEVYQQFFDRLSKSVFLEAQQI